VGITTPPDVHTYVETIFNGLKAAVEMGVNTEDVEVIRSWMGNVGLEEKDVDLLLKTFNNRKGPDTVEALFQVYCPES
jgi:hypothetical protein